MGPPPSLDAAFSFLPAEKGGPHLGPSPTAATCLKCLGGFQFINHILIWTSRVKVNYPFLEDLYRNHAKGVRVLLDPGYPDKYARREDSYFYYRPSSEVTGVPCCVPGGVHTVWT